MPLSGNSKQILCMLLCCCGPPGSLLSSSFSSEIQHGIVPPRYSTAARSKDDLVQLALSCFGSPTRLSLCTWECIVDEYLTDQPVVGNIRELCITFRGDNGVRGIDLNKLLSSSNRLVSLHIDFSELYQAYVKERHQVPSFIAKKGAYLSWRQFTGAIPPTGLLLCPTTRHPAHYDSSIFIFSCSIY